jgi:hypothetical protein
MPISSDHATDGEPRHRNSLAWRLILPVPLTLAVVIGVIWALLPRIMESTATHDAFLSNQQVATQFKTIRGYYSEFVATKVAKTGQFTATHDHKNDDKAIPIPATFMHDLSDLHADKDTTFSLYSRFPFSGRKERKLDGFGQRERNRRMTQILPMPIRAASNEDRSSARHGLAKGSASNDG